MTEKEKLAENIKKYKNDSSEEQISCLSEEQIKILNSKF